MGDTWITDITDFPSPLDSVANQLRPAIRLATYLGTMVSAATSSPPGEVIESALRCRRRPKRQPCGGYLNVQRQEVPLQIVWACSACDDNGVITGWKGTVWDLSRHTSTAESETAQQLDLYFAEDEYRLLRSINILDTDSERIVLGARRTDAGIRLKGTAMDLEELLGSVAFEANHEAHGRRQHLLDQLCSRIESALAL